MNEDVLFQLLRDDIKEGFREVNERLDGLNGRVRMTEQEVAVLKDRGGRRTAAWGGAGVAVATIIETVWHWVKP